MCLLLPACPEHQSNALQRHTTVIDESWGQFQALGKALPAVGLGCPVVSPRCNNDVARAKEACAPWPVIRVLAQPPGGCYVRSEPCAWNLNLSPLPDLSGNRCRHSTSSGLGRSCAAGCSRRSWRSRCVTARCTSPPHLLHLQRKELIAGRAWNVSAIASADTLLLSVVLCFPLPWADLAMPTSCSQSDCLSRVATSIVPCMRK